MPPLTHPGQVQSRVVSKSTIQESTYRHLDAVVRLLVGHPVHLLGLLDRLVGSWPGVEMVTRPEDWDIHMFGCMDGHGRNY